MHREAKVRDHQAPKESHHTQREPKVGTFSKQVWDASNGHQQWRF